MNLAITIYGLLLLILMMFLPLDQARYSHRLVSSNTENIFYLPLVERVPESVIINIPCEILAEGGYDWIIEFKGGTAFQVFKDKKIGVVIGDSSRSKTQIYYFDKILAYEENCVSTVKYLESSHTLQIFQNGFREVIQVDSDFRIEILNNIVINNKYAGQGVSIIVETSPPSDVSESKVRKFVLVNLAFLLIFSLYATASRINSKRIVKHIYSLICERYFLLTILLLLFLGIILPPRIDDGWRMTESWVLNETGVYNNYIVPSPLPTGRLLATINGVFLNSNNFAITRLPSVIALLLTWLVSVQVINKLFNKQIDETQIKRYVTFVIILFSAAFLIGLRAEVYIATLLSLSFLVIVYEKEMLKTSTFQLLLSFSALALALHQSGLSVAVVCFVYGLLNYRDIYKSNFMKNPLLIIAICTTGLSIFYENNIYSIYRSIKLYSNKFDEAKIFGDVATLNPLMEYKRFLNIFRYENGLFTFASLLLVISVIFMIYLYNSRFALKPEKNFILIMLSSFFAILLTPSKWAWYYMNYLPLVIISLYFFIYYFAKLNVKLWLIIFTLIPLISILNQNLEYSLAPIVNFKLKDINVLFRILIFTFVVLILLVFIQLLRSYYQNKLGSVISDKLLQSLKRINYGCFLILILYTVAPLVLDSRTESHWSYIKQNLMLGPSSSCGLFPEIGIQTQTVIDNLDNYPYLPCFKPLLFRHGVWEYPNYIVQSFNILDQQRLGEKIEIEASSCVEDFSYRFEEICIYKTSAFVYGSSLKQMELFPQY